MSIREEIEAGSKKVTAYGFAPTCTTTNAKDTMQSVVAEIERRLTLIREAQLKEHRQKASARLAGEYSALFNLASFLHSAKYT